MQISTSTNTARSSRSSSNISSKSSSPRGTMTSKRASSSNSSSSDDDEPLLSAKMAEQGSLNWLLCLSVISRWRTLLLLFLIVTVTANILHTVRAEYNIRLDAVLTVPVQTVDNMLSAATATNTSITAANFIRQQREQVEQPTSSLISNFRRQWQQQQQQVKTEFEPPKYNYKLPPVRTKYTVTDPILKEEEDEELPTNKLLVFVMSARSNFERRQAIRETWGKDHANLLFVIGGPEPHQPESEKQQMTNMLFNEQNDHQDLLDSIHPESYRSLPYKLHYTFQWVRNQTLGDPDIMQTKIAQQWDWFLKVDDDVVVRIPMIERLLIRKYNPHQPIVIGDIIKAARPKKEGKWAEDPHYDATYYPPWPRGAVGYIVSRPVAEYLGTTPDLYYYQGEDAGLGIWLEEAHKHFGEGDLTWIDSPAFDYRKGCSGDLLIVGHNLSPDEIRSCYNEIGGNVIPTHKSRIFTQKEPLYYHKNTNHPLRKS